ncbi:MAG: GTP cyclohydrolase FolE2 [Verrucomicrobiota bacterium]|nr:GTP cyclohydrolase FolE2 [Verrucomicrobiota bacterium]
MKDVQNSVDNRRIQIRKAGIKNLRCPVIVLDKQKQSQQTIAAVDLFVDLPHHFKGTHMSRFVEILNQCRGKISVRAIDTILKAMLDRFHSETSHLAIRFPYFIEKAAPVSGEKSLMDYTCGFLASMERRRTRDRMDLIVEVVAPVTTLCPCSRAISREGAHNQRSWTTIQVRTRELVWLEDLIEMAEAAASAPLYALLKREDEKRVTEQAYANPRFAEDIVRAIAGRLRKDPRILWYKVETENLESIHNHNAFAQASGWTTGNRRRERRSAAAAQNKRGKDEVP